MSGTYFERLCRLCAKQKEVTVMLYSQEAADKLLLEKLRKYLHIEIDVEDKFPKNICIKCCSTLQTLSEFIEQIQKAQNYLYDLSSTAEMTDSSTATTNAIKEEATEYTEISVDPMEVYMPNETCTESYKYPYAEEVVTLKLIENNENQTKDKTQAKKSFECKVCNKSFLVEQSLKNHSWVHIQDEEYSCFTCQKSFRYQADLNKHIQSHIRRGYSYVQSCEICNRRFRSNYTYEIHMRIHRSAKTTYDCKVCGTSYGNLAALKVHKVTHSSEKPFQCSLCEKRFKRNQQLKFHMNSHTGAKPYKCKHCDKSFSSTGNLYTHKNRLHRSGLLLPTSEIQAENGKPLIDLKENKKFKYHCIICNKGYQRHENYVFHMFQHTGEKPFKCTHCPQKCITQRSLSSHYNKLHPTVDKPAMPMPVFCPKLHKWL